MARELIDTGTDKRFVRRDEDGQFKESDDTGRSLSQDQERDAKTKAESGEGAKGDCYMLADGRPNEAIKPNRAQRRLQAALTRVRAPKSCACCQPSDNQREENPSSQ